MLIRSPTASAARIRRVASPGDSRNTLVSVRTMVPWVSTSGRLRVVGVGDKPVVDQRHPVPDPFECLHDGDKLRIVEIVQPAVFDHFDQMIEAGGELVQGIIHRGRRIRRRCFLPENHVLILLETMFDSKI